jgi:antitoxin FitA
MSVSITIRDIPQNVRDELAARAARSGRSLQSYLNDLLVRTAAKPSSSDVIARARARAEATGTRVSAEAILQARDIDRR